MNFFTNQAWQEVRRMQNTLELDSLKDNLKNLGNENKEGLNQRAL